ncbi:hypothetical protein ACRBEV_27015 [Methylobacterium phyllosphaerae]
MKRRSARPFTVEVKHTRTSRAPLSDATARSRKNNDLWQGLPLIADDKATEVKPIQPVSVASSEAAQPETPARRVLPSLVPTFAMPIEPEVQAVHEAPAPERLPRVPRAKPPAELVQKPALRTVAGRGPRAVSAFPPQVTPAAAPASIAKPAVDIQPAVAQARTARRSEPAETLRLGERWKRRLPRVFR